MGAVVHVARPLLELVGRERLWPRPPERPVDQAQHDELGEHPNRDAHQIDQTKTQVVVGHQVAPAVTAAKSPHDGHHRHPLGHGCGEEPHRTGLGHGVRATADSDGGGDQSTGEPGA